MGGDIGKVIAQAGMGFMQGAAEASFENHMRQQQNQQKFGMDLGQQLAARGELGNLSPDMLKPMEKLYGKAGMAQLMQLNQMNQLARNLRMGAEQTIQEPIREERTIQSQDIQGPITPQGEAPKGLINVTRDPTNQEMFQRAQEMGPMGAYMLTGDTAVGGLAAQQEGARQREQEYQLAREQHQTDVARDKSKAAANVEEHFVKNNTQFRRFPKEQGTELIKSGQVPEGVTPHFIGDDVFFVKRDKELQIETKQELESQGIDPNTAKPEQIANAIKTIYSRSKSIAGESAREKARMDNELAMGTPLIIADPTVAAQYHDINTGNPVGVEFTLNDAKDKGKYKRLTNQQVKDLDSHKKFYYDLKNLQQVTDRLYKPGGALHGKDKNFLGRLKTTSKSVYDQLMQTNPDLIEYARIKGQMAQAFNRGEYGGVGTQTEPDRKFSMQMFPKEGQLDQLADTPEVALRLMQGMEKRILNSMRVTLGNKNFTPTPIDQMGEEQSQTAPAEQPQEADTDDPEVERLFQESGGKISRDVIRGYIQEQQGQKKNSEVSTVTPKGQQLLAEFEGMRTEMYDDATGETINDPSDARGYATIGIGHLLTKAEKRSGKIEINGEQVDYRGGLSEEHVMALLEQDTAEASEIVDKYVKVDLTPEQRDALISFAFNIGEGNFKSAGAIKALNNGDVDEFLKRHAQWNRSKGKEMRGLTRRREAEAKLFTGALHG